MMEINIQGLAGRRRRRRSLVIWLFFFFSSLFSFRPYLGGDRISSRGEGISFFRRSDMRGSWINEVLLLNCSGKQADEM